MMDVYALFFPFYFFSFSKILIIIHRYILIYVFFFYFVEPITSIVGEPEMFIDKDSTMNLTCVVRHSPEPPTAIYWTHDDEVLNFWYINICIWNVCMQIILCSFVYMMEKKRIKYYWSPLNIIIVTLILNQKQSIFEFYIRYISLMTSN